MTPATDIRAQLRAIRRAAGLTQRQLGVQIDCSAKTVANIEGGRRGASVAVMARWAIACGRSLSIEFHVAADAEAEALAARVAQAAPAARDVISVILDSAAAAPGGAIVGLEDHVRAWIRSVAAAEPPRQGRGSP